MLLPWIQVAAYRANLIECPKIDHHAVEEELADLSTGKTHLCRTSIHDGDWNKTEFDGAPYEEKGSAPVNHLETISFSQAGNKKHV